MCNDGPHQGQFHEIASGNSPVIFNNSCWSWSEISTFFLAGGSRSYIGTLWGIDDIIATNGSVKFYGDTLNNGKNVAQSVWEINKNLTGHDDQKDIFFAWTLPFTKIEKAKEDDFENFVKEVVYKLARRIEKSVERQDSGTKENLERVIKFVIWVTYKEFGFNLIELMRKDIFKDFGYDLGKHSYVTKRGL